MRVAIIKGGIVTYYEGRWYDALRCKLALHKWKYWHMAPSFIDAFPKQANVCRNCVRCKSVEMTDDGITWFGRV